MEMPDSYSPPDKMLRLGDPLPDPAPPFQFSVLSIFVLTAAVAFYVTIVFALPDLVAGPFMLAFFPVVLAGMLTICIFGSGWLRVFVFGVSIPCVFLAVVIGFLMGNLFMAVVKGDTALGTAGLKDPEVWSLVLRNLAPVMRFWFGWTSAVSLLSGIVCLLIWSCLPAKRSAR